MAIIIEHPTRGTLRPDSVPGNQEWHWSSTGLRNDSDKTWQFTSLEKARFVYTQLPEKVRREAKVLQYTEHRPLDHPDAEWTFPRYLDVTRSPF